MWGMGSTGTTTKTPTKLQIVNRDWDSKKDLSLSNKLDQYRDWRDRALGFLTRDRPDVKKLLRWAEEQEEEIDEEAEKKGADIHLFEGAAGITEVTNTLYDGIKHTVDNSLLQKGRDAGEGRGLEFWRKLHLTWLGLKEQVLATKVLSFTEPPRCGSMTLLWEALPAWKRLGEELDGHGIRLPEVLKSNALLKLVPESLVGDLVGRSDLRSLQEKMNWVARQAEHASGAAKAAAGSQRSGPRQRMDKDGDATMNEVTGGMHGRRCSHEETQDYEDEEGAEDLMLWQLHEEWGKAIGEKDHQRAETMNAAILAISKGKGKGKGPSQWGKGGGMSQQWKGNPKGGDKGGGGYGQQKGGGYGQQKGGGYGQQKGSGARFEGT